MVQQSDKNSYSKFKHQIEYIMCLNVEWKEQDDDEEEEEGEKNEEKTKPNFSCIQSH